MTLNVYLLMKSPQCAKCPSKPCYRNPDAKKPSFCPMESYPDIVRESLEVYEKDKLTKRLHQSSTLIEKEGYGQWPRIREVVELCKKLGIKKIGIAFCIGLSNEAKEFNDILEKWNFETYSVVCKCGSFDKSLIISEKEKLRPDTHESMCNPVLQAMLLNHVGTELNVVIGLCVGHDSIFMRYSKAPVVYLISKDRVTGHNPAVSLYAKHYFSKRLEP